MMYYITGILLLELAICQGTYIYVPGADPEYRYKIEPATEFLNGRGLREADAKAACASDGASLYWYYNEEEFDAVRAFMIMNSPAYDMQAKYRIGGVKDLEKNVWIWEEIGEEIPQNMLFWADDEPNNIAGDEYCLNVRRDTDYLLNDARCRKPMGYICKKEIPYDSAVCNIGDTSIDTFDGGRHGFTGECKTLLAESCLSGPYLPYFKIVGKKKKSYKQVPRGIYPHLVLEWDYIEIELLGAVIRMEREAESIEFGATQIKVQVNGESVNTFSYDDYDFSIDGEGKASTLRMGDELEVYAVVGCWEEINVFITVSPVYYSWMCGMCGDFDGIWNNDIPDTMTADQFGAFHQVYDPSDPECDQYPPDSDDDPELQELCNPLRDTAGPFGACVAAYPNHADGEYKNCITDISGGLDLDHKKELRCPIFEDFARQCLAYNIPIAIDWRVLTDCITGLSCQDGFTSIHGMCYLFETSSETKWQEAVDSCEGMGAALLYINSEPELTAIRDHIKADPALLMQSRYWLSGKKVDGDWYWNTVGGDDILIDDLFWDFEEPTNEPAENCLNIQNAAIGHDYLYNDAMCTKYIGYICKAAPETP